MRISYITMLIAFLIISNNPSFSSENNDLPKIAAEKGAGHEEEFIEFHSTMTRPYKRSIPGVETTPMPAIDCLCNFRFHFEFTLKINSKGDVVDVILVTPCENNEANLALIKTLKKWKFTPATLNDKPVSVLYPISVNIHPATNSSGEKSVDIDKISFSGDISVESRNDIITFFKGQSKDFIVCLRPLGQCENHTFAGTITVESKGVVKDVLIIPENEKKSEAANCLKEKMLSLTFPATIHAAAYSFSFIMTY